MANCVFLIGRLTADPEVRYTSATNTAIAAFTVAVNRPTKEKQTDFPRIKVIGRQAENCEKYLKKGRMVAVEGSIETGDYESNGKKVYFTDVLASRVEFIDWGEKTAERAQKEPQNASEGEEQIDGFESLDEDVPF